MLEPKFQKKLMYAVLCQYNDNSQIKIYDLTIIIKSSVILPPLKKIVSFLKKNLLTYLICSN